MFKNRAKEKETEKMLKALANIRRLKILNYLYSKKEASVGDISESIRLSFRSTSRHLAVLMAADIIDREQRGLEVFYRILHPRNPIVELLISSAR